MLYYLRLCRLSGRGSSGSLKGENRIENGVTSASFFWVLLRASQKNIASLQFMKQCSTFSSRGHNLLYCSTLQRRRANKQVYCGRTHARKLKAKHLYTICKKSQPEPFQQGTQTSLHRTIFSRAPVTRSYALSFHWTGTLVRCHVRCHVRVHEGYALPSNARDSAAGALLTALQ